MYVLIIRPTHIIIIIIIIEQAHIVMLWLPSNPLDSKTRLRLFGFPLSVNHRPFWPPDDSRPRNKIKNP